MKKFTRLLSAALLLTGLHANNAQSQWVQTLSGPQLDVVQHIAIDSVNNEPVIAGSFELEANIAGISLQSAGGKDVFVAKTNNQGIALWSLPVNGPQDEEVSALACDQQGFIYLAGSFWQQMSIGSLNFVAPNGARALFLAKIASSGQVLWVQTIEGSGIKSISDIVVDDAGQVYIGGYFGDLLSIHTFNIQALGDTDLFLAAFSPQGQALWATRAGNTGDTRIIALALAPAQQLLIAGGFFNLTTIIGDTTLTANTYDRDVFLAAFDLNGQAQWAKKAGGVHDNELTDIAIADNGNIIYACGYLVGVMNLGNNLSIQSANGNPDFFILKYNPNGTPLAARAMGGALADQAIALTTIGKAPYVTGFFKGSMNIDGRSISAPGQSFAGFVAGFNDLLQNQELHAITAVSGQVFPAKIAATGSSAGYYLSGSFQGSLQWGNQVLPGAGSYDGFIGKINATITGLQSVSQKTPSIRIFPQPASKIISIQSTYPLVEIRLFNMAGELVLTSRSTTKLSVESLSAGEYALFGTFENGEMAVTPLIIVK